MKTILVMELKGFESISSQLAWRMGAIQYSEEKIRSVTIHRVEEVIGQVSEQVHSPQRYGLIGGDTWYFVFDDFTEGLAFGCGMLYRFYQLVVDHSILYIKPSMAINIGNPSFDGQRFLDNDSINTYRKADKGEPFTFYAIGSAITEAKRLKNVQLTPLDDNTTIVSWTQLGEMLKRQGQEFAQINMSHILLHNEIQYLNSNEEVVRNFINLQESASTISAFGGAVPYDNGVYWEYLTSMKRLIESKTCKCSVITYINSRANDKYTYFWLKWCQYLTENYRAHFTIAVYDIAGIPAKPISFHIYDESIVHIGLREYSLHMNQPVMSASIVLKNREVASRFYSEFRENFRSISHNSCRDMLQSIQLSDADLEEVDTTFRKLLEA